MDPEEVRQILDILTQAGNAQLEQIRQLRRDVTHLKNQMAPLRINERGRRAAELRAQAEADDD